MNQKNEPKPALPREPEAITIDQALRQGAAFLREKGFESPRLEIELMMAHALGVERIQMYLKLHDDLSPEAREKSREYLRRRVKREPLAYILGRKEFYGLSFEVTPDTLIPRPETELAVDRALKFLKERAAEIGDAGAHGLTFADIGTGAGTIAIATLAGWKRRAVSDTEAPEPPPLRCVAVEISPAAIEVAKRNAAAHGVAGEIDFRVGDLVAPLNEPMDLITANPPYVPEKDRAELMPEVGQWEPAVALFGGGDGTEIIRRLIEDAPAKLKPGGGLIFEIGYGHGAAVESALRDSGKYQSITIHPDLAGIPRVAEARLA